MSSLLYTAELDLAPEDRQAFLQWYAYRHVPDLYPIGFITCSCYHSVVGDMAYFDIYEIPTLEIFSSEGYARMNKRDVYAAEILAKRRNKAHTLYQHRQLLPEPIEPSQIDADWLSVLRLDTSISGERFETALAEEAADLIAEGASVVRFAERSSDHPTYTTHRPRLMLIAEWTHRPSPEDLFSRLGDRLAGDVSNVTPFLGHRVYPWPDRSLQSLEES